MGSFALIPLFDDLYIQQYQRYVVYWGPLAGMKVRSEFTSFTNFLLPYCCFQYHFLSYSLCLHLPSCTSIQIDTAYSYDREWCSILQYAGYSVLSSGVIYWLLPWTSWVYVIRYYTLFRDALSILHAQLDGSCETALGMYEKRCCHLSSSVPWSEPAFPRYGFSIYLLLWKCQIREMPWPQCGQFFKLCWGRLVLGLGRGCHTLASP